MFPISDSHKSEIFPFLTLFLIALNVYVFFLELTAQSSSKFIELYALTPSLINFSNPNSLTEFISAMFLHAGIFHLLSNMWFLWIFGDNIEATLGRIKYLLLYILTGLSGNFLQYLLNPSSQVPILGASGAISGILGAYLILHPRSKIRTFLIIFFFITITEIPAVFYLFYWFFIQFVSGVNQIGAIQEGGVAFWAHIGGFVSGVVLAKLFKRERKSYIEGEIIE